ncbi:hypothetical protein CROQUDRAFT_107711 [Cronartium quercuum f. sp. fusiforme G11]|uniref:RING-type domain-containing protein n=1 Tax=Cronartium quercuum f. sp. fusiforme G11 TaxID=708437 RepID=A0A9P6NL60_9BASI|nr:hypothetical protein CROQUDRAFT_107711 [Cronartium quercuum f. sp. fusiforme G11]
MSDLPQIQNPADTDPLQLNIQVIDMSENYMEDHTIERLPTAQAVERRIAFYRMLLLCLDELLAETVPRLDQQDPVRADAMLSRIARIAAHVQAALEHLINHPPVPLDPLPAVLRAFLDSHTTTTNADGTESGDENECAICLQPLGSLPITKLPCFHTHTFHRTCVDEWVFSSLKTICPLCRTPFSEDS